MKKRYIILILLIILLIGIRIALPFIVKNVINKKLSNMEGYRGGVEDVDLALYRGAYVFDSLHIVKMDDSIPVPFVAIRKVDISIHWKALFKGKIVGEFIFTRPEINFAVSNNDGGEKEVQDGSGVDWVAQIKDLIPLQINRVEIVDGTVNYRDFTTRPKVDITLTHLDVLITNLSNIEDKTKKMPSTLVASANTFGKGSLSIDGRMNVLKSLPDADINLKLENVQLADLNDFLNAYARFDAEKGVFNLYTEVLIDNGNIDGYVKPILQDVKILDWDEEDKSFLGKIWEAIAGGVVKIFSNPPKDQFASEVPLSGDLNNLDTGVFPALLNILKNAFVEAFSKELEHSVGEDAANK